VAAQQAGNPAIVIATKSHLDDIVYRLRAENVFIEQAIETGRFVPLDVSEVLSGFMVDDMPDPVRFFKNATGLLETATKAAKAEHARIAVCGEGVSVLLAQSKALAALQLEQFWNLLAGRFELDILCAYSSEAFNRIEDDPVLQSICAEHSAIYSR
jgi:MEDS: MEthanogen/methylotroph, DcmR Sensory domain